MLLFPFLLPFRRSLPGLKEVSCGIDLPEPFFDHLSIPHAHLVRNVPYFMSPAPLDADRAIVVPEHRQEPLSPIYRHNLHALSGQSPLREVLQKRIPFGSAFGCGQTKVDYLFFPVMSYAEDYEHRSLGRRTSLRSGEVSVTTIMPQLTRQGAFRKSLEQHGFLYYNTIAAKQLLAFSRQKKRVATAFC